MSARHYFGCESEDEGEEMTAREIMENILITESYGIDQELRAKVEKILCDMKEADGLGRQ